MTPTEEIQAAVAKLERLRGQASPGEWNAWRAMRGLLAVFGVESNGHDIALMSEANARLIAVLHGTIPALLHILGNAHETEALGLARAINGDDS